MLYEFDFYHYAGIDRPVVLYRTPNIYIEDIDIATSIIKDSETSTGMWIFLIHVKYFKNNFIF